MQTTQAMGPNRQQGRKAYLEWMRLLACAAVIYNHLPAFTMYTLTEGPKQGLYMTLTILCRINIPLFLMISGAVLLQKEESCAAVLKKRAGRILLAMLVSEFGIYGLGRLLVALRGEESYFSWNVFFRGFLARDLDGTTPCWYLYAYLGFLCFLPFLQRIAKGFQKQEFCWLLILHGIFQSLLPLINHRLQITNNRQIQISGDFSVAFATSQVLFYPLIGYYLEHRLEIRSLSGPKLLGLCAACGGGVFLSCLCRREEMLYTGSYTQNYTRLFDYLLAITAFLLIKYFVVVACPALSGGGPARAAGFLGSLTFGIYLLHVYFLVYLHGGFTDWMRGILPGFSTLAVSLSFCLFCMLAGGLLTLLLRRLPLFRRFL